MISVDDGRKYEFHALRVPQLYPSIEPYDSGWLEVGGGHRIYWEACGNPKGRPALFLHGGPGGGCRPLDRRFFNPECYRIILFDQRGCGRSLPHGRLQENTTADLISDIETLRNWLGIRNWLLLGGSWGSTLALAYAQAYPEKVRALVLRGIFTARARELDWLYRKGASCLFPEAWQEFCGHIPAARRHDLVSAYHERLTCGDPQAEAAAARAWCAWEESILTLEPRNMEADPNPDRLRAMALLETHYFLHRAFMGEGELLANVHRLHGIPGVIVQGRYDVVTPAATAWELHQGWPGSELHIVPDAGHASSEPGIVRRIVAATDRFSRE